jgi:hypothetical protein
MASAMTELWNDPARRLTQGEAMLDRARARFTEKGYTTALRAVYERLPARGGAI